VGGVAEEAVDLMLLGDEEGDEGLTDGSGCSGEKDLHDGSYCPIVLDGLERVDDSPIFFLIR
jgi:hypothetical protein